MQNNRVIGLDLLRSIAILLVVVSHCSYILYQESMNPIVVAVRSLGAIGVDLFFVLSGYLIGGILLKQIQDNRIHFKDFVIFWKRRWFRTLPNYFLVLIINILIIIILHENLPDKVFLYFPFFQNFLSPHPDFFTEAWSLSIEEYSYLILPLFLLFSFRIFKRTYLKENVFIWATVALILVQFFFKISFYFEANITSYSDWSSTFRKVVIYRLDAISYGFILIYCCKKYPKFIETYNKGLFALSLAIFIIMHLLIFKYNIWPQTHLAFYVFAYLPSVAVCCALIFPIALQFKPQIMLKKSVYFLSTRSYAIYLLNYSIILLNLKKIFNFEDLSIGVKLTVIVLFLGITLVLSELLYRFFEKPILDYRNKTYSR
ncbi:acyltransferase family protein [Flavobacteriaceae bacterium LMO-SS05]